MSSQSIPPASLSALPEARQEQIAKILDEYLTAAEAGEPIAPDELLARYPDEAAHLRGCLSGLQLFHACAADAPPVNIDAAILQDQSLRSGKRVADFDLIREIGRGGMGVVYEAVQRSLNRRVALKLLPFASGLDKTQIQRFKNEAQAAANVDHPHIVPVFAVGESDGAHFYAMQLIEGESLAELLTSLRGEPRASRLRTDQTASFEPAALESAPTLAPPSHAQDGGPRNRRYGPADATRLREVAKFGVQAARALHAAHQHGVVHRDIKPSNLLVDQDRKLWIADFGLARTGDARGVTQTGNIIGTMRYMSPEQAQGDPVDHRTDIYSLGVTLYELASLHHPAGEASDMQLMMDRGRLRPRPLRQWDRRIPRDLQTIIMKAISESPAERYATAEQLADDLQRFLDQRAILATPPGPLRIAAKWCRRRRRVVGAAAAVMIAAWVGQTYYSARLAKSYAERGLALADSEANLARAVSVLDRFGARTVDQLNAIPGAEGVRFELLHDCLEYYRQFEGLSSDNAGLTADAARALGKMGQLREKLGEPQAALDDYRRARQSWVSLIEREPENTGHRRELAACDTQIGLLLVSLGREEEALRVLGGAKLDLSALAATRGEAVSADLAAVLNNQAMALQQLGRHADAVDRYRQAIALLEDLPQPERQAEPVRLAMAGAYSNLAALADELGTDDAVPAFEHSIKLLRGLVESDRVNRLYQGDLARAYSNLGCALSSRDEWTRSEACHRNAVTLQSRLVSASPLAISYRRDLAISLNNLGMAQAGAGLLDEAQDSFHKAISLQQRVVASMPASAKALSDLGGMHNNLGLAQHRGHRTNAAPASFRSAVDYQGGAVELSPQSDHYRELLHNHYANFAGCLRDQDAPEAANAVLSEERGLFASLARKREL